MKKLKQWLIIKRAHTLPEINHNVSNDPHFSAKQNFGYAQKIQIQTNKTIFQFCGHQIVILVNLYNSFESKDNKICI